MFQIKVIIVMGILSSLFGSKNIIDQQTDYATLNQKENSIYQFKVETLEGEIFDFSTLKGRKVLIVNTASKCGLTPQYKQLQELYEKYGNKDFEIIGFPANDFLSQEPGSNEEIGFFCERNYGVSFPMMAKVSVKGKNKHEIYKFLTEKALNGVADSNVKWNFQKYLIGEEGFIEKCIAPRTSPLDSDIIEWIEN